MRQPDAVELRNHDCLVNIFDKDEMCFLKDKFQHDHPLKIVFKVKWNDSQQNSSHSIHHDDSKTTLDRSVVVIFTDLTNNSENLTEINLFHTHPLFSRRKTWTKLLRLKNIVAHFEF